MNFKLKESRLTLFLQLEVIMANEKVDSNKAKALASALAQIEKQFGKGSIMKMSEKVHVALPAVSTGSLKLDDALGIGGLPYGRIVEIYGPESSGKTTLTLQVLAAAQKEGKTVAFVDAEHALDPIYAEKLGVQVGDLLVSQPDTGEQALEITDTLVRSGAVDVIIIDSVAALVPKAEIDGEMGDSHMGLQARLMSQALRKLAGAAQKNNVLIIFINQIRMKIGVMFGCFHYNARVHLADGTSEKIGKLVNQRRNVEVLSWNSEKQILEPKKIQNWFNNGKAEKFLQITVEGGKSGRRCLPVTENHTIFTPDGEVSAGELSVGDEVLARHHDFIFNEEQMQLLMGSSLGDGSIRKTGFHSASFRFGHGEKQKPYLQWKHDSLRAISSHITQNKKGHVFFDVLANAQAAALKVHLYGDKKGSRKVTKEYLSKMDARAIAVWYMDDGTFGGNYEKWGNGKATLCNRALDSESREFVVDFFEKIGVGRPTLQKNGFQFNSQQTNALHSLIAPYIHPSMDYKLHPSFRGKFNWVVGDDRTLDEMSISRALPSKVIAIYEKPKTRSMNKFDLEIEDNHNYLIDGVVVHNSPETTTGGNALKFYASVRLDIRRTGAIKKGEDIIGNETRIKVVKNKVAPPFKQVEVELLYGEGISKVRELLDYGLDLGVFEKSGAWYSLKEGSERMGQGKENAIEFLKANPQWQDKVEALVRANMVKALKSAPAAQEDEEGLIDE